MKGCSDRESNVGHGSGVVATTGSARAESARESRSTSATADGKTGDRMGRSHGIRALSGD
jgi:hypothetical protein